MADKTISGIVTWLKGWFYDKDEITTKENALQTQINNKASQTDLNTLSSTVSGKLDASDYVVDSALSDSSTNPVQNKAINTALSGKANSTHSHTTANVTEATALSHIGTSANATQHDVNSAIDTLIGNLTGAEIIKVVTTLPTASASTMNALYLLSSNSQYDIYITVESSGSYAWEKLDDDVLSDLSIDWSDINNIPSTFTPSSHTHGQITNDGKITSTAVSIASGDNILITDASDSSVVKRVATILSSHMKHSSALANIGTSANATQSTINTNINTKLGSKAEKSQVIDWDTLTLVPKATDETGAITFDYLE